MSANLCVAVRPATGPRGVPMSWPASLPLDDAVHCVRVDSGPLETEVLVMLAGMGRQNASDVAASREMGDMLRELRDSYDPVVIDSLPMFAVSDAIALTRAADGAVVLARVGVSQRGSLSRVAGQLRNVDADVPGVAVNAMVVQDDGYGHEDNDDAPDDSGVRPGWITFSSRERST